MQAARASAWLATRQGEPLSQPTTPRQLSSRTVGSAGGPRLLNFRLQLLHPALQLCHPLHRCILLAHNGVALLCELSQGGLRLLGLQQEGTGRRASTGIA